MKLGLPVRNQDIGKCAKPTAKSNSTSKCRSRIACLKRGKENQLESTPSPPLQIPKDPLFSASGTYVCLPDDLETDLWLSLPDDLETDLFEGWLCLPDDFETVLCQGWLCLPDDLETDLRKGWLSLPDDLDKTIRNIMEQALRKQNMHAQPEHCTTTTSSSTALMQSASSSQALVKRSYDLVAVFPLVKPRSCLNVKFCWTMIRTLRSNFPAKRPGVTRWVHPRFPRDGVITLQLPREDANRSSTTDESRVQLMSLSLFEYNW